MKQFIAMSKDLFGIGDNQTAFEYNEILSIVRNKLVNDNYKFDVNNKIIDEKESGILDLTKMCSYELAMMYVDNNERIIRLSDCNYMGFGVDKLRTVIAAMGSISLQQHCEESLEPIRRKFPIVESEPTFLVLLMLLTYDMGMKHLSACIASILFIGMVTDRARG